MNKPPFEISGWLNDLRTFSPDSDYLIVGNKSDLLDVEDEGFKKRISALEQRHNSKVHLVSAKSASGVKNLFIEMKIQIMKRFFKER